MSHINNRSENAPHVESKALDRIGPWTGSIRGVEHESRFPGDKDTKRVWRGRPLRKMEHLRGRKKKLLNNLITIVTWTIIRQIMEVKFYFCFTRKKAKAAVQKIWFQYDTVSFNEQNQPWESLILNNKIGSKGWCGTFKGNIQSQSREG